MRLKRWLYLTHRWLGVTLCAFFAMWFFSGVVMMYVGYPKLTSAERLQHLPTLGDGAGLLAPAPALAMAGVQGPLRELRLAAGRAGRPVYLALPATAAPVANGRKRAPAGAGTVVIDAVSGQRLPLADRTDALASAAVYLGDGWPLSALAYHGEVDEDAFTHSRALDAHRPLHRVEVADADGTWLWISSLTGEVVRDASRVERVWNFAGAWIHWLYPFRGNGFNAYWSDIVIWLSVAGIVVTLLGAVVGVMRWRFRSPYRSGARTPYPGRAMRWHHVSGLLFAVVTLTWIFSGLMSMNPWRVLDANAAAPKLEVLQGTLLMPTAKDASPSALLATAGHQVRELRWWPVLGELTVQAHGAVGRPQVLSSQSAQAWQVDAQALRQASARLLDSPLDGIDQLDAYDFHYYDRAPHTMTGGNERPLPVWRVRFRDEQASWVHLDPLTGTMVSRSDTGRRANRWLFALLHSWDWLPMLQRRPLWDAVMLMLSVGGGLLSVTALVIGWRRLVRVRVPVAKRPSHPVRT